MSPRGRSYTIEREEAEGGCEAQSHHSHRRRQHHLRCVCAAGAADRQKGPTEKDPVPLFTPWRQNVQNARKRCISVSEQPLQRPPSIMILTDAMTAGWECYSQPGGGYNMKD